MLQSTLINPLLLGLPVERPEPFTGNRRDWRRFSRQLEKYDRDIQSMGTVTEAARIRILAALLDKAGKMKLETLQREAQIQNRHLTFSEAKTHLNKVFEVGAQDARAELKALVPSWHGGRPGGPAWRDFAEEFRYVSAIAPEISEEEKREHLLNCCLTQQFATMVLSEDRKRAQRPKAIIIAFKTVPSEDVKMWLRDEHNIETTKVETTPEGHRVQCASPEDMKKLSALHKCTVANNEALELVQVYRLDTKLTTGEILDLVGNRLGDEKVYNDGRRVAQQAYARTTQPTVQFSTPPNGYRRRVRSLDSSNDSCDSRNESDRSQNQRVAAVEGKKVAKPQERRPRSEAQRPPSPQPQRPPSPKYSSSPQNPERKQQPEYRQERYTNSPQNQNVGYQQNAPSPRYSPRPNYWQGNNQWQNTKGKGGKNTNTYTGKGTYKGDNRTYGKSGKGMSTPGYGKGRPPTWCTHCSMNNHNTGECWHRPNVWTPKVGPTPGAQRPATPGPETKTQQ